MESLIKALSEYTILQIVVFSLLFIAGFWCLYRVVKWAKGMPKVAFLILAVFPLLNIPNTASSVQKCGKG